VKVLIVSDIHANRTAFEAVIEDAGSVDAVWHLGDIVGYGPDPGWCVDRLIALDPAASLAGNHDLAVLGVIPVEEFNPVAARATEWTATQISQHHRAYLARLPAMSRLPGLTLAHGSPRDPVWEYIADAETANTNFGRFDTPLCLVGHTHVPCAAELAPGSNRAQLRHIPHGLIVSITESRWIINPGSVGQPRDSDPRAAFAIYDSEPGTISFRRVEYDVADVQRRIRYAGLPDLLATRLALGQ
jgi:diadenosine tetraphosphatase ApaH/serine/threonine PP2A family protein phosphatase